MTYPGCIEPHEALHVTMSTESSGEVSIELRGEVDAATVDHLEHAVEQAMRVARERVTLDISRLAFIDAGGFHALERLHRRADSRGLALLVLVDPWKMRIAKIAEARIDIRLAPGGNDVNAIVRLALQRRLRPVAAAAPAAALA